MGVRRKARSNCRSEVYPRLASAVSERLMAKARDSRTFGKSDPIDALAVSRAALR
jgi:hypothetical protein